METDEIAHRVSRSKLVPLVLGAVVLVGAGGLISVMVAPVMIGMMLTSQSAQQQQHQSGSCGVSLGQGQTSVQVGSLTQEQVQVAHQIWQVAHETGFGDRGAIVGIATAAQESTLGADRSTARMNGDGDVAVFQQRAYLGWYAPGTSVEENVRILSDVRTAARTFFLGHTVTQQAWSAAQRSGRSPAGPVGYHIPGLVDVPGWEQLPLTVAAQKVQRSAYPDAYAKHEPTAATLVQRFAAEAGENGGGPQPEVQNPALCGNGNSDAASCPDSGLAIESGLTPDGVRVLRCVKAQFPELTSFGGVGDRPANVDDDHQTGRAVDIMIPGRCNPLGQRVVDYVFANQAQLGVKYIIWCDRIWSAARNAEGWRSYSNPNGGNDTLAHRDHVHVSVNGNSAGAAPQQQAGGSGKTVSPMTRYTLTARFGQCSARWANCHTGLDFAGPTGTPLLAVADGTVISVGWGGAYGNLTKLDHGGGLQTWYAHQSATDVQAGQQVTAGQTIGRLGSTGNVTGPHLHFEVRQGGTPTDPAPWLRSRGVNL